MASNKKDLKAYVRYDGTGRIVSSSVILQRFKPKDGNWQEIQAYECCDPSCSNPVYEQDWVVDDVQEVYGGYIFSFLINPYIYNNELQFQFLDCDSLPFGQIITINASTEYGYNFFVSDALLENFCGNLRVRRICGFNYQSAWVEDGI